MNLEKYTYSYLLNEALSKIPDKFDKREGSIIFDAVAPACYVLAGFYMQLNSFLKETYVFTASGKYLDYRAAERGIVRKKATCSVRRGSFYDKNGNGVPINIGARFSTADASGARMGMIFYISGQYENDSGVPVPGEYLLTCETAGTEGDLYVGDLIPITPLSGIVTAVLGNPVVSARDEESDDELRTRYITSLRQRAFGGNINGYREAIMAEDGVGGVQIYPCWDGGGTVKCCVRPLNVNADFNSLADRIQDLICPVASTEGMTEEEVLAVDAGGYGFAPIGALVTVCVPEILKINISADIKVKSPFNEDVRSRIELALDEYLEEIRKDWDVPDEADIPAGSFSNRFFCNIYSSKILSAILSVPELLNVSDVKLNGSEADIIIENTSGAQYLPVLGEVVINVRD